MKSILGLVGDSGGPDIVSEKEEVDLANALSVEQTKCEIIRECENS